MFTLKKLFYPEVLDICPNCGEACALTDILCPKCGKNLDEHLENLPDVDVIYRPSWIAKGLANPQVIKRWNIANSIVLVVSLFTPWIGFFYDNVVIKFEFEYVIGFRILVLPLVVLYYQQVSPTVDFLPAFILTLEEAIAPAIVIYYAVHGIRAALQIRTEVATPVRKSGPAIFRFVLAGVSLVLIQFSVGFNSFLTFGYTLAVIGLLSASLLELGIPLWGSSRHSRRNAA
jgi:hypothetical protein